MPNPGDEHAAGDTPKEMTPGEWVVGYYEDDETQGFIGESGGSICILDDLPLDRATRIAALHNRVVEMKQTRIEALEKRITDAMAEYHAKRTLENQAESHWLMIANWKLVADRMATALAAERKTP
jgi:hypothetical protein